MMTYMNGNVVGHLTVGCSITPGKSILPHLLARFHHQYPQVRETCQVSTQQQTMQMLDDGAVHFALTSLTSEKWLAAEFHKFFSDRVRLIASLNHHWAIQVSIQPDELVQAEFILREKSSRTYKAVRVALASANIYINELKIHITLGNSEAIVMAVHKRLGVVLFENWLSTR